MNRRSFLRTSVLPALGVISLDKNTTPIPNIKSPKIGSVEIKEDLNIIHRDLGLFPAFTGESLYPTTVEVPISTYNKYKDESKSFFKYFNTLSDDKFIQNIVDQILPPVNLDNPMVGLTMLIRREAYRKEYKDSSRLFYTRHPVETVIEGRGDCVDKALFLHSCLANLGYSVGYALLPNHLSVIVQRSDLTNEFSKDAFIDDWITVNGTEYGYIEVVNTNKINDPLGEDDELEDIYFVDTLTDGFEVKNISSIPKHIEGSIQILFDRLTY